MRRLHSSWRTSSCATARSTTSTRTGLTASPSSSAPQGALRCRLTLCLVLRPPWVMWLMEPLHHLCPKTAPWRQGARPHDAIHHARCPRAKREAAEKFLGCEKLHLRFPRRLAKTARYLRWRHAGLIKTKLHLRDGPRQPRSAAAPSPPSYVAPPGRASSSRICLLLILSQHLIPFLFLLIAACPWT